MPTGYTYTVADGTVTELKPFIMQLARGMGALVTMRDDPADAPIPERFEPSTYSADELIEAREKLAMFLSMNEDSKQKACLEWNEENDKYNAKVLIEQKAQRKRYSDMIEKVKAWNGAPEGIKEFALSQLQSSIEFDTGETDEEILKYYPKSMTTEEWYNEQVRKAEWDISYHEKQNKEEIERTESRNAWLKQLRESLDGL